MKILITGSSGFIGTHLSNEMEKNGHAVVPLDKVDGDLLDPNTISLALDKTHPDVVIHLAAKVGRAFGEDDLSVTIVDNAVMTAYIAKACGERGIQLVYASTSEVYGDIGEKMAHESQACSLPHNLYGLTKRWGEEAALLYAPSGLVRLRLSMPYGPGLPAGRGRAAIINFLYNALQRKPLTVHRHSERSWCWVGDTVRGIRMVVEREHTLWSNDQPPWGFNGLGSGIWNIGRDDQPLPMHTVATMACAMTRAPFYLIEMVDAPGMQTVVKRLSTHKLRSIGWEPKVDIGEGMMATLDWIKDGFPPLRAEEIDSDG